MPTITCPLTCFLPAARAGRDSTGDATAGLLAGLCTPGGTLWVTPDHPGTELPAELPEPVRGRPGKVSTPIARPPSPADAEAMATEAAAEPEFRFLPVSRVTAAAADGAGLVVLDGVPAGAVPDLGVPVLRVLPA